MENIEDFVDVDSLSAVKDVLIGLRSSILSLAELKVKSIGDMKGNIEELIKTAEIMEVEKMFIKEMDIIKQNNAEITKTLESKMNEADKQVRKYL